MLPAIDNRETKRNNGLRFKMSARAAAANDNAPTHALWRKIVAAGIGTLFALALILVGLVCTTHAAEPGHSSHSSGQN